MFHDLGPKIVGNVNSPDAPLEAIKVCSHYPDGKHRLTELEPVYVDQGPEEPVDYVLECKCGYFEM
jgi:hypothetical protein